MITFWSARFFLTLPLTTSHLFLSLLTTSKSGPWGYLCWNAWQIFRCPLWLKPWWPHPTGKLEAWWFPWQKVPLRWGIQMIPKRWLGFGGKNFLKQLGSTKTVTVGDFTTSFWSWTLLVVRTESCLMLRKSVTYHNLEKTRWKKQKPLQNKLR